MSNLGGLARWNKNTALMATSKGNCKLPTSGYPESFTSWCLAGGVLLKHVKTWPEEPVLGGCNTKIPPIFRIHLSNLDCLSTKLQKKNTTFQVFVTPLPYVAAWFLADARLLCGATGCWSINPGRSCYGEFPPP